MCALIKQINKENRMTSCGDTPPFIRYSALRVRVLTGDLVELLFWGYLAPRCMPMHACVHPLAAATLSTVFHPSHTTIVDGLAPPWLTTT